MKSDARVVIFGGGIMGVGLLYHLAREGWTDSDCAGNEPVYAADRLIGITTSGAFGHAVGKSLAFAYVPPELSAPGNAFDILMLGERRCAVVLAGCALDPANQRLKA